MVFLEEEYLTFPWDPKEQCFNTVSPRISAVAQDSQLDSMIRNARAHLLHKWTLTPLLLCSAYPWGPHSPPGPHDASDLQAKSRAMVNIPIPQNPPDQSVSPTPQGRCILSPLPGFRDSDSWPALLANLSRECTGHLVFPSLRDKMSWESHFGKDETGKPCK